MTEPAVTNEELEAHCDGYFYEWKVLYARKDYGNCKKLTDEFIGDLKPIYKERLYGEDDDISEAYTFIYLFLILAKGLEDMIDLVSLTKNKNWPNSPQQTELIWQVLWDAKERFDIFYSHCTIEGLLDIFYEQLQELEYSFYDLFGKGIYMSTVIRIKKSICSVCGLNIKACLHMPGDIYKGIVCKEQPIDFKITGADMVQSPHDMRCRVWPWNFTDDWHFEARLFSLNQLDHFIHE